MHKIRTKSKIIAKFVKIQSLRYIAMTINETYYFNYSKNTKEREKRLKNNYNFDVVKHRLKFNQRTQSTPHKF